jgi:TPR repeat protein
MSELNEATPSRRRNPLIWILVIVVGMILFVFLSGERGDVPASLKAGPTLAVMSSDDATSDPVVGTIERSLLVPPGMRARQYIEQIRAAGKPYPLSKVYEKALQFRTEGSLADAHLLFFFAARENHLPAMMMMGEMSDPVRFRAQDSLLDQADAIQAFKWYSKAAQLGQPIASERLDELGHWASEAAATGDSTARQLLLNIK